MGVTSVRDPGNDDVRTIERRSARGCGRVALPARLRLLADRRQRPLHRAGRQRRHERARSDRAGGHGEEERLHRREVLRHVQPRVAAREHRRSAQARAARPRPHPRRHPAAAGDRRRLRRDHPHQLGDDAGGAGQRDCGLERHHALRRSRPLRQGRRSRWRRDPVDRGGDGAQEDLQRSDDGRVRRACTYRRTASCRPRMRRSSARCRRPRNADSAPAASRCPRI